MDEREQVLVLVALMANILSDVCSIDLAAAVKTIDLVAHILFGFHSMVLLGEVWVLYEETRFIFLLSSIV